MKGTLLFSKIKINVTFSFNIFKQKIKIPWFSSNDTDSRTTFCEKITVILRQRGGKRLNEEAGFEKKCRLYGIHQPDSRNKLQTRLTNNHTQGGLTLWEGVLLNHF